MAQTSPYQRLLFGLKIKHLRQQKGLSFAELSEKSGLSVSYLNEIEKGKKYPKEDKILTLAAALEVQAGSLTEAALPTQLQPVAELLKSNFLNELPLDVFGIELPKVVEIIANSPARVGAFISTLVELSRHYALGEEHFYLGALRSYQEIHQNYFPELEQQAQECRVQFGLDRPDESQLASTLITRFNMQIEPRGLDQYPELQHLRSLYLPKRKTLLLHPGLDSSQRATVYAKELAFQYLQMQEGRSYTSPMQRFDTFDQVLLQYQAAYFASAVRIPREQICSDLKAFFNKDKFDPEALMQMQAPYDVSPEMFFQRLSNLLPQEFGIKQLFFLRFVADPGSPGQVTLDRELHLTSRHHPHRNRLNEHYCRRWLSVTLLQELTQTSMPAAAPLSLAGAQLSHYHDTPDTYLCFTLAKKAYPVPSRNSTATLGLLVDRELRQQVRFVDDPAILTREVNNTCERCPLPHCESRIAPPQVLQRRQQRKLTQDTLRRLLH